MTTLAKNRVDDFNSRYYAAVRPLQQAIAFLSGGWWEVCVADAAVRCGFLRDVRWSVDVGEPVGYDT